MGVTADPDARLGYAYVMNRLDFYLSDDPREKASRDAVYRAIAYLDQGSLPCGTTLSARSAPLLPVASP